METAIKLRGAPELMVVDEEKAQVSSLVQGKLDETSTLTIISNDAQFGTAGNQVKSIAHLRRQVEALLRPYIDFWHRGHKAHTQLLGTLDRPLEARERSIEQGLARYQREKEEARRREEERLRREAEELRREMEEEERRRREAEEAAAKRKLEEEALAEAAAREAEGDHETAALILEHAVEQSRMAGLPQPAPFMVSAVSPSVPIVLVAPVAQATAPKVRGLGFREVSKWRMKCGHKGAEDPACATCQSVPREYLVLDPRRVQARVEAFRTSANIPGIEVWMECQTSVRRKY